MSKLITDYLAQGLAAARPATPANPAGTISYYYATDTGVLSVYAGGTWQAAGGGGAQYTSIMSATTGSTAAFATKGTAVIPLVNMSFSDIWLPLSATSGHSYRCTVAQLGAGVSSATLGTVVGTATAVAGSTASQTLHFVFSSPVALVAGQRYAVLFTDTSAASGTTSIPVISAGSGAFHDFPMEQSTLSVSVEPFVQIASLNPLAGASCTIGNTSPGYVWTGKWIG